jgi:hypothetical protein
MEATGEFYLGSGRQRTDGGGRRVLARLGWRRTEGGGMAVAEEFLLGSGAAARGGRLLDKHSCQLVFYSIT